MEKETQDMTDHDLLVGMHTTLKRAVEDIKALDGKVTDFNNSYAKKVEMDQKFLDVEKKFANIDIDIKWLSRIAYGGLGILAALEYYFNYIKK